MDCPLIPRFQQHFYLDFMIMLLLYFSSEREVINMSSTVRDQARELRQLLGGFQASRVILTGTNFGVFDLLTTPKTAEQCAHALGTNLRGTETLLNALTGLNLLKKTGMTYRNLPVANKLLVQRSPVSMWGMARHLDTLWENWSALDDVVQTGMPARKARDHESFIRAMHSIAVLRARSVVKNVDLTGVKRALDLGGGPGTYSIELAKRGIRVTLFDLPDTIRVASEIAQSAGAEIEFQSGNFLNDPIAGKYDLVFISQIVHSFSENENRLIIEKSKEALSEKGKIVIQEFFIDESGTTPASGALFSINMLVNTEAGRCYSPREIKTWLTEAGFARIKQKRMEETVLISAMRKQR